MEQQLYSFDPATHTSRAPMPTKFEHLLGFAIKDERFLTIHNQEQLININEQLNQTLNLQVSNIISRVIATLIGLTDTGWRVIEATEAGALKVAIDGLLSDTKTLESAIIWEIGVGLNEIIAATAGFKIHVINIVFTVAGEVNVKFQSAANDLTGLMDFGAAGEPRGMVIPLGVGPLVCTVGEAFNVDLSAAVRISGFCTYYKQLA